MAHNPYMPPAAPIEDVIGEDKVAVRPPWQVRTVVVLCCLVVMIGLPQGILEQVVRPWNHASRAYVGIVLFYYVSMVALLAMLYLSIYRGRRWARIVYALLVIAGVLYFYKGLPQRAAAGTFALVSYLLGTLVDVTNTVLLFLPASNAWFRKRR